MRFVLRSKIHRATVTDANLNYIGSITIDSALLKKVGIIEGEKVLVTSVTSGSRLDTYVIAGEADSGVVCINGSAAHLIKKGEIVVIMGFELTDSIIEPSIVNVDSKNRIVD